MSTETSKAAEIYVPTRPTWEIEVGKRYAHMQFPADSAIVKGFDAGGHPYFDHYLKENIMSEDSLVSADWFRINYPRLSDAPVPPTLAELTDALAESEKRLAQAVELLKRGYSWMKRIDELHQTDALPWGLAGDIEQFLADFPAPASEGSK